MRTLGRYELLTRLASGAMGELFLARPLDQGGGPVVVKKIHGRLVGLQLTRLLNAEAAAGQAFSHPGAVRLLEVVHAGDTAHIVTELVRGQPLSDVLRRARVDGAPLPQAMVAWIGAEVADVLAAAHQVPWFEGAPSPMVHGAVSPRAILLTYDGQVRLAGLGFGRARAKVAPEGARLPYAAPEVLHGRDIVPRTDAYGLGVTLHDGLSGRPVYRHPNPDATRAAVLAGNAPPLPPRSLAIDPGVADLVQSLMAPRVDARPGALDTVANDLRGFAGDASGFAAALAERMEALYREEREIIDRQLGAAARASERQARRSNPPAPAEGGSGSSADLPSAPSADLPSAPPAEVPSAPPAEVPSAPPTPLEVPIAVDDDDDDDPPIQLLDAPAPSPTSEPAVDLGAPVGLPPDDLEDSDGLEIDVEEPATFASLPDAPATATAALDGGADEADDDIDVEVDVPPPMATLVTNPRPSSFAAAIFGTVPPGPVEVVAAPPEAYEDEDDDDDSGEFDVPAEPMVPPATPLEPGEGQGAFAGLLAYAESEGVIDHLPDVIPEPEPEVDVDVDLVVEPPVELAPEAPFGRYEILRPVREAEGRARYLAHDPALDREVWLDVVEGAPDAPPVQGFRAQMARFARISHPKLLGVLDLGITATQTYAARPAVHGGALASATVRAESAVRGVLADLAAALSVLHEAGECAGGLTGHDVWRDADGNAIVTDLPRGFGFEEGPSADFESATPEGVAGAPFDASGDLFALGLLAHRMLTGSEALPQDSDARQAVLQGGQIPVPAVRDEVLQTTLQHLLAASPRARFSSAEELLAHLQGDATAPSGTNPNAEANVILVDADLDAVSVRRTLAARGVRAAVFADLEAALEALPSTQARTVIVARGGRLDEDDVRRRLRKVDARLDVRFVPAAASRLVGPPLSLEGLAEAWASLAPRVVALAPAEPGLVPTTASRAMAQQLGLGLRAELLCTLAAGARMLARKLGESPARLSVALPEEAPEILEAVERIDAGTLAFDGASRPARIVAVADGFYRATRFDGVAPSRALADVKARFDSKQGRRVIDALILHLRELYATGDLAPPAADAPRVLVARRVRSTALVKMLEFDGLQVEEAANGDEAWEILRVLRPDVAVVDADLEGRDGVSLVELSGVHPAMADIRFLLLGEDEVRLRERVATLQHVQVVPRNASVESLRARVSGLVERAD